MSGRPPVRLLDEGSPDTWSELDLAILAQWKYLKEARCPGCGRPLAQHLHNSRLGREEKVEDYKVWSIDCPAVQAISSGQDMWATANQTALEAHRKGHGPDPRAGVYWLSQGFGEALPQPEK